MMQNLTQWDLSILLSLIAALSSMIVAFIAYFSSQRNRRDLETAILKQNPITEGDGKVLASALANCKDQVLIVEPGLPALLEFQDEYLRLAREGVTVRILITEVSENELSSRKSDVKSAFNRRYSSLRELVQKSEGRIFVRSQPNRVQSPLLLIDGSLFVFPFHNFFNYASLSVSGSPMFSINDLEQSKRFSRAFEERWENSNKPGFLVS